MRPDLLPRCDVSANGMGTPAEIASSWSDFHPICYSVDNLQSENDRLGDLLEVKGRHNAQTALMPPASSGYTGDQKKISVADGAAPMLGIRPSNPNSADASQKNRSVPLKAVTLSRARASKAFGVVSVSDAATARG